MNRDESTEKAVARVMSHIDSPSFVPPMLPAVAQEALALARHKDVDMQKLMRVIERDQVLAARFLAVANSPLYRGKVSAQTVAAALVRIGLANARDLLFFTAVEPVLFTAKEYASEMASLRDHSLAVSAAAAFIAKIRRVVVEQATLAGLVHDIGAAAVLHAIAADKSLAWLRQDRDSLAKVVSQTHAHAGRRLAMRWSLPELVVRAIGEHHGPPGDAPELVIVAAAADELATFAGLGSGLEETDGRHALDHLLGGRQLADAALQEFLREAPAQLAG